jgi:ethanolamine utilization protein EutN
MRLAKVVGQVVATVKEPGLDGFKILLVEDLDVADPQIETTQRDPFHAEAPYPAIDLVGAGEGEVVLVTAGSAARVPSASERTATDAAVVAIVDTVIVRGEVTFKK